jgi:hypothetical protein
MPVGENNHSSDPSADAALDAYRESVRGLLDQQAREILRQLNSGDVERLHNLQRSDPLRVRQFFDTALRSAFGGVIVSTTDTPATQAAHFIGPEEPEQPMPEAAEPLDPLEQSVTDDLISPSEFARLVSVRSTETIRQHVKDGHLIGWRTGPSRFVLPRSQLDGANRYIPHLAEIGAYFDDPAVTWAWLNRRNINTQYERPLERLRDGDIEQVRDAAAMYREGAFT